MEHPENNEKPLDQKSRDKFKIMSLKVKAGIDYVPELVSHLLIFFVTMLLFYILLYNRIKKLPLDRR